MTDKNSIKKNARIAGLYFLLVAITSGFAAFVRSSLIVPGDGILTAKNILASETLFRTSIVSDLVGQVFHIVLALALYELFKKVNKKYALLMLVLALVPVPIAMFNQVNQFSVLQFLSGTEYSQILFFMNLHSWGVLIAQIFWGLWLLPLGYLFIESRYVPKFLSILLIIAGLGYLTDSFGKLLLPNYNMTIAIFTFIGEITLLFWLLIKSINVENE